MKLTNLVDRNPDTIIALTMLWKKSVLATHTFLDTHNIRSIEAIMPDALTNIAHLTLAIDDDGSILGFIGIDSSKIEMLFIRPESFGMGVGSTLINFAITTHDTYKIDVNEDNKKALHFYQKKGFHLVSRSETDGQGKPLPILHLERRPK